MVGGADNADVTNLNISTTDIAAIAGVTNITLGLVGFGTTSMTGVVNAGASNVTINGATATFAADTTFTATTTTIAPPIIDDTANNVTFNGNTVLNGTVNTFGGLPHDGWDVGNLAFNGTNLTINGDNIIESTGAITYPTNVIGTGALAIVPLEGTTQNIGGVNGVVNDIPTAPFTGFAGHLIIGGSTNPLTPTVEATEIDINAALINVNSALITNGAITLLGGDLNIASDISAGGAGGSALMLVASGTDPAVGSTAGTGDILVPNNLTQISAGNADIVAVNDIDNPGNMILNLGTGVLEVSTGAGSAVTFGPGSTFSTGAPGGSVNFNSFIGLFSANLSSTTVSILNPAADLIGLEELGFIDTGLFEQDLTLFGVIGQGIALALAQCEEIEGCAPNVTEEELNEFIAQIEARLEELLRRASEAQTPAEKEKLEELIAGYQQELKNFIQYRQDLQEYLTVEEEEFDEDFDEEDFGVEPDAVAIQKLAKMLETVNARLQWLESLKGNPEERARLSKSTGIDLTQEVLEDIIDGAKSEAKYIEKQIKLLQEGTEAKIESAPLFIAEAGDYRLTQVVNYGPSLLNLGNEHINWLGY